MPDTSGHLGVARIDQILEAVARAPQPPRLTDITAITGLPRSTVADLVGELRRRGYLQRINNRYSLGRRTQILAMIAHLAPPAPVTHSQLEELSRTARAPLALAALVGSDVIYLDTAGARAPQRLQSIADSYRPRAALRTAAGRLLLTFADDEQRNTALLSASATDPEAATEFLREQPAIKRSQIARSDGLADPEIQAIAIPVREHTTVIAAIVILGPRSVRHADRALEQAAERIQKALRDRD